MKPVANRAEVGNQRTPDSLQTSMRRLFRILAIVLLLTRALAGTELALAMPLPVDVMTLAHAARDALSTPVAFALASASAPEQVQRGCQMMAGHGTNRSCADMGVSTGSCDTCETCLACAAIGVPVQAVTCAAGASLVFPKSAAGFDFADAPVALTLRPPIPRQAG